METKKLVLLVILLVISSVFAERSVLYPDDWDGNAPTLVRDNTAHDTIRVKYGDKFLHDFSYAGYEKGEKEIPTSMPGQIYNVLDYGADNTGVHDATEAIQNAINAAQSSGGGTVYLPAGTYGLFPPKDSDGKFYDYAIKITGSNILFKGDGVGKTHIRCDLPNMRYRQIIQVGYGENCWGNPVGTEVKLTKDISNYPTTKIEVEDAGSFNIGDWVVIRSDRNEKWIEEHYMVGFWDTSCPDSSLVSIRTGVTLFRQITKIDYNTNTITVDIPTRYNMKKRDNARIYKINSSNESGGLTMNTGLQDFSIGNLKSSNNGWKDDDYLVEFTGGWGVDNAFLIKFEGVVNGWLKNVKTYNPGNTKHENREVHMVSNGLDIKESARLTIDNCDFSYPQFRGGNGNGYGMNICGSDLLIINCSSTAARHSYSFKYAMANGNVIYNHTSDNPRLGSDFHMHLSPSNLIDNQNLINDFVESNLRYAGSVLGNFHGQTSTQTVFWNTKGIEGRPGNDTIVDSRQYGYGYVIGTGGKATKVKTLPTTDKIIGTTTEPIDHTEHIGNGTNLEPKSLYDDQWEKRRIRTCSFGLIHNYSAPVIVSATCETEGSSIKTCLDCGKEETETLPALGHAFETNKVNWTDKVAATCSSVGSAKAHCINNGCNVSRDEEFPIVLDAHFYGDWITKTPANCVLKEVQERNCLYNEEHNEIQNFGEPLGHSFAWEETIPVTCKTDGEETEICSSCQTSGDIRVIDKLGHNYGDWEVITSPTCEAVGVEIRICLNDENHFETQNIPQLTGDECDVVAILDTTKLNNHYGIKIAPNPVSDNAEINIILPNNEKVVEMKIAIYDNTGNRVFIKSGKYSSFKWDLRNNNGRLVSTGTFIVVIEAKSINERVYNYSAKLGVKR